MTGPSSKFGADTPRVEISRDQARAAITGILKVKGCATDICEAIADHLIDADDSGVESHGVWRITQYANYYDTGYLNAASRHALTQNERGAWIIEGHSAIGIPAMSEATAHVVAKAKENGLAAIALKDVGHTGRLGAFAETAAAENCLLIIIGGGGREKWRLVAPYGGAKALMSTNPYCIGIPGGARGPVILDFATSAAAGGRVYGAKLADATLPDGILIDREGNPTRNPQDYFDGGAILPAGGAKGYALAVAAEMIAEALLGPVSVECNWLMIAMDCGLYREAGAMQETAEEILAELRNCPPAPGFQRVEIPGERERDRRAENASKPLCLPTAAWAEIEKLANSLGVAISDPQNLI